MSEKQLSSAEAELYDRQIRLWGIESQEKLRAANVLLIGIRGLGSEIAKNILLSGINSLTILDDGIATEEEQLKNFLLERKSIGNKIAEAVLLKAQTLNPLVRIVADTENVTKKSDEFFTGFTIVVATGLNTEEILRISGICRKNNIKFICGDVFGMFGFSISDFQEHDYYEDRIKLIGKKRPYDNKPASSESETVRIQKIMSYPQLSSVLTLPKEQIKLKLKRKNPYYFLMLVVMEFRNRYGKNPSLQKMEEDIKKLKELKIEIFNLFQISSDKLNDEVFGLLFGELVTVCSIVGGVIAQEVIKAVSHKEVPINNVFLFNPLTYGGQEEIVAN